METSIESRKWEVAEIQLSYKSNVKPSQRPKITSSLQAYEVLRQSWDQSKIEFIEQFKILLLNRAHKVLGLFEVSTGGIAGTVADPKVIFAAALLGGASGIILCHNHPSGNLTASQSDIELTRKLKEGAKILEMQLLDHIIISSEKYLSFTDEGLI